MATMPSIKFALVGESKYVPASGLRIGTETMMVATGVKVVDPSFA